jgi:hypothetical protein
MSQKIVPDEPKVPTKQRPRSSKADTNEQAFRRFIESGSAQIPNIVILPQTGSPSLEGSKRSEAFTFGYALALAALLAGAIFGGIALGTSYSAERLEDAAKAESEKVASELSAEIDRLRARLEQLERTQAIEPADE